MLYLHVLLPLNGMLLEIVHIVTMHGEVYIMKDRVERTVYVVYVRKEGKERQQATELQPVSSRLKANPLATEP